ncbi:MAG: acetyltransferase [Deltaproteobacteria bacterium]|nr:acetyltransferase [Kofleriaceae bacterium]
MTSAVQVLGAGGHARVVVATLLDLGHYVTGVWDDDPQLHGTTCLGVTVRGAMADAPSDLDTVIAIGDNVARARIAGTRALPWLTAIHPRAYVHPSATLGAGTVVFAGAIIQPQAVLGAHVIVNTSATIDHDCRLGDFVHLGPGVHLCGNVTVEVGALLGVAAAARPGARVGAWAVVGAGAVVIEPVASRSTATGIPARAR